MADHSSIEWTYPELPIVDSMFGIRIERQEGGYWAMIEERWWGWRFVRRWTPDGREWTGFPRGAEG